jgi:hypothetical protein
MPSRNERIYIYSEIPDLENITIDFPVWWDRNTFFFRYGDRKVDTGNPIYVNYAYKLSRQEAIEFDAFSLKKTYPSYKKINPLLKVKIQNFRAHLEDAKWVIIESYEWESGL